MPQPGKEYCAQHVTLRQQCLKTHFLCPTGFGCLLGCSVSHLRCAASSKLPSSMEISPFLSCAHIMSKLQSSAEVSSLLSIMSKSSSGMEIPHLCLAHSSRHQGKIAQQHRSLYTTAAHMHTCTHTHTRMHARMHARTHTHTNTHMHTTTHTHTHTTTYITLMIMIRHDQKQQRRSNQKQCWLCNAAVRLTLIPTKAPTSKPAPESPVATLWNWLCNAAVRLTLVPTKAPTSKPAPESPVATLWNWRA